MIMMCNPRERDKDGIIYHDQYSEKSCRQEGGGRSLRTDNDGYVSTERYDDGVRRKGWKRAYGDASASCAGLRMTAKRVTQAARTPSPPNKIIATAAQGERRRRRTLRTTAERVTAVTQAGRSGARRSDIARIATACTSRKS